MHFDLDDAIALTRFAATALDVEAEPSGVVAASSRFRNRRKQFTHRREQTSVGRRIGARSATDRTLVDVDDPVDLLESVDAFARRCVQDGSIEPRRCMSKQRVDGESGFAGAGDSGHARQQSNGDFGRHIAQVVSRSADDPDHLFRVERHAVLGQGNLALTAQVLAGDRRRICQNIPRRSLRDDVATVDASAGTEVDDVVGLHYRFLIVLDDDHRVADVAERLQGREQSLIVTLVQSDRRLVQDIHDTREPGADLTREADALRFAARKRLGAAIECQVVEPDIHEETKPVRHVLDDLRGDLASPPCEIHGSEELKCLADCQMRGIRQTAVRNEHEPRGAIEPGATAIRAWPHAEIFRQLFTYRRRFSLAVTSLKVGKNALERVTLARRAPFAFGVTEFDGLAAAAIEEHLLHLGWQLVPRRLDIELVVSRERLDELEVVDVAPVPAADRTARKRQVGVHHDPLGIEELLDSQAVASRAGAGGIVEGEQLRLERRDAVAADRAGMPAREDQLFARRLIQK